MGIVARPTFATHAHLGIVLGDNTDGLPSSTTLLGAQSPMIDNTVTKYRRIYLNGKVKSGTSTDGTFAAGTLYVYALRGNLTLRTDGAAATSAWSFQIRSAQLIAVSPIAAAGATYQWSAVLENPGPEWGIAISHNTVADLHKDAAEHDVMWIGETDEVAVV